MKNQRILLVGDYNRSDFLYIAREFGKEIEFFFIEYLNADYLKNKECLEYGTVLYWKNYKNAFDLLEKIKPSKVIFYFIESYNHVALNVAARLKGVPTYHLEHGIRNLNFKISFEQKKGRKKRSRANQLITSLLAFSSIVDRYKNYTFFTKTITLCPEKERQFLRNYYAVRKRHSIFNTFKQIRSRNRLADTYISYSPKIFAYHQEFEGLPSDQPVNYIGIPYFDHFFQWKKFSPVGDDILFIDQPLYEHGLMGWTKEAKLHFLMMLLLFSKKASRTILVKPHPSNDKSVYDIIKNEEAIVILEENSWEQIMPRINAVIGFSSTLLMPFMAMDNICCFSLEVHPHPPEQLYSQIYLDTGACSAIFSFDELFAEVQNLKFRLSMQSEHKNRLIDLWMYKFDGQSSERLRKILIKDEIA